MDAFLKWWNSLTPAAQNVILGAAGGVGTAAVLSLNKTLRAGAGRALKAAARLVLRKELSPATPPALPSGDARVEPAALTSSLPPRTEDEPAKPLPSPIPRPPVVGFVARRGEDGRDILASLKQELAPEKGQLVALRGAGGVGKTTLAAETARALSEAFAGRVAWVSADGRADFSLSTLLDETAEQLGNTELRPLPLDKKAEQVRLLIAEARTLVVLDNFETIKPEEQTRCAQWLAHATCCAVITSRMDVSHAHHINIPAMSLPEARKYLKQLIGEARNPRAFKKLDQDQIINAADRNPHVLQWVIQHIDRAKQPGDVLGELARGRGDAAQRVFDRSFNLLSDDGRATLLALSLFAPSASRPTLAQVAGFDMDIDRLNDAIGQLSDLWLIGTTEGNERLTVEGLTRSLSGARLSKEASADEFRQRFVTYFRIYAQAHEQVTPEDFNALEVERDNLLSAMDVAFQMKQWDDVMRIRAAMEEFLDLRGYWEEAIHRGEQTVTAAQAAKDEAAVIFFAINTATIRSRRGEYEDAKRAFQQALDASRKLENLSNVSACLHNLGYIAGMQGNLDEARRLFEESLEISKVIDNQSRIGAALHELGRLALAQGRRDEARRLFDESLEIHRRLGDESHIAGTLHELGRLARVVGDMDEARRLFDESLEIEKRLGNQNGIAISLRTLGLLAAAQGDKAEAVRLLRDSLSIFERLKSLDAETVREELGMVERKE